MPRRLVQQRMTLSDLEWPHHALSHVVLLTISFYFYLNVTTLRLDITIANPSVDRLSVTFVDPTQWVKIFGNISTPLCTLAII